MHEHQQKVRKEKRSLQAQQQFEKGKLRKREEKEASRQGAKASEERP